MTTINDAIYVKLNSATPNATISKADSSSITGSNNQITILANDKVSVYGDASANTVSVGKGTTSRILVDSTDTINIQGLNVSDFKSTFNSLDSTTYLKTSAGSNVLTLPSANNTSIELAGVQVGTTVNIGGSVFKITQATTGEFVLSPSGTSITLTVAQANEVKTDPTKLPNTVTSITIKDTATNIKGSTLISNDFAGKTVTYQSTDALTFNKAEADAFITRGIKLNNSNTVTLDDSTNFVATTFDTENTAYTTSTLGGSVVFKLGTSVTLTKEQASNLGGATISTTDTDIIVELDDADVDAVLGLTLGGKSLKLNDNNGDAVSLSPAQVTALKAKSATFDSNDKITLNTGDFGTIGDIGGSTTLGLSGGVTVNLTDSSKSTIELSSTGTDAITASSTAETFKLSSDSSADTISDFKVTNDKIDASGILETTSYKIYATIDTRDQSELNIDNKSVVFLNSTLTDFTSLFGTGKPFATEANTESYLFVVKDDSVLTSDASIYSVTNTGVATKIATLADVPHLNDLVSAFVANSNTIIRPKALYVDVATALNTDFSSETKTVIVKDTAISFANAFNGDALKSDFINHGVDLINITNGDSSHTVEINKAKADALKTADIQFENNVAITVSDTESNISALINDATLNIGGDYITLKNSAGTSLTLTKADADLVIANRNLEVDSSNNQKAIVTLTANDIKGTDTTLGTNDDLSFASYNTTQLGGYEVELSVGSSATITNAQALTIPTGTKFTTTNTTVTITVTDAQISNAVLNFNTTKLGGSSIVLDDDNGSVTLTNAQVVALKQSLTKFSDTDDVIVQMTQSDFPAISATDSVNDPTSAYYPSFFLGSKSVTLDMIDNKVAISNFNLAIIGSDDAAHSMRIFKFADNDAISISNMKTANSNELNIINQFSVNNPANNAFKASGLGGATVEFDAKQFDASQAIVGDNGFVVLNSAVLTTITEDVTARYKVSTTDSLQLVGDSNPYIANSNNSTIGGNDNLYIGKTGDSSAVTATLSNGLSKTNITFNSDATHSITLNNSKDEVIKFKASTTNTVTLTGFQVGLDSDGNGRLDTALPGINATNIDKLDFSAFFGDSNLGKFYKPFNSNSNVAQYADLQTPLTDKSIILLNDRAVDNSSVATPITASQIESMFTTGTNANGVRDAFQNTDDGKFVIISGDGTNPAKVWTVSVTGGLATATQVATLSGVTDISTLTVDNFVKTGGWADSDIKIETIYVTVAEANATTSYNAGYRVILQDTKTAIEALNATQIQALLNKNIDGVDSSASDVTNNLLSLTVDQINAWTNDKLNAEGDDIITLADNNSAISVLTPAQLTALTNINVVNSSDALTLTNDQLTALGLSKLTVANTITADVTLTSTFTNASLQTFYTTFADAVDKYIITGTANVDTITAPASLTTTPATIKGGADTDTLEITGADVATNDDLVTQGIEVIKVTDANALTLKASNIKSEAGSTVASFGIASATGDITVNSLASTQVLTLGDIASNKTATLNAVSSGAISVKLDDATTSNATSVNALTTGANVTTLNLESADTDTGGSTISTLTLDANTTTVNIGVSATHNTNALEITKLSLGAGTTVNATYSDVGVKLAVDTATDFVLTFNGSTSADSITGGDANDIITSGGGVDSLNGGAGNNRIILNGTALTATIDGGTSAGTNTLEIQTTGENLSGSTISNIDTITYNSATVGNGGHAVLALTLAGSTLDGNTITINDTAGNTNDQTDTVTVKTASANTTLDLSGITLGNDVDNFNIDVSASTVAGGVTITDASTQVVKNITMGSASGTRKIVLETDASSAVRTIAITGNDSTDIVDLDGSTLTNTLTLDLTKVEKVIGLASASNKIAITSTTGVEISGSSVADTITGGLGNDTITGNGGDDAITLGATGGNDTVVLSATGLTSGITIANFTLGTDTNGNGLLDDGITSIDKLDVSGVLGGQPSDFYRAFNASSTPTTPKDLADKSIVVVEGSLANAGAVQALFASTGTPFSNATGNSNGDTETYVLLNGNGSSDAIKVWKVVLTGGSATATQLATLTADTDIYSLVAENFKTTGAGATNDGAWTAGDVHIQTRYISVSDANTQYTTWSGTSADADKYPSYQRVIINDSASAISALSADDITHFATINVDGFNANDDNITLSKAQIDAMAPMSYGLDADANNTDDNPDNPDNVTLSDTSANIVTVMKGATDSTNSNNTTYVKVDDFDVTGAGANLEVLASDLGTTGSVVTNSQLGLVSSSDDTVVLKNTSTAISGVNFSTYFNIELVDSTDTNNLLTLSTAKAIEIGEARIKGTGTNDTLVIDDTSANIVTMITTAGNATLNAKIDDIDPTGNVLSIDASYLKSAGDTDTSNGNTTLVTALNTALSTVDGSDDSDTVKVTGTSANIATVLEDQATYGSVYTNVDVYAVDSDATLTLNATDIAGVGTKATLGTELAKVKLSSNGNDGSITVTGTDADLVALITDPATYGTTTAKILEQITAYTLSSGSTVTLSASTIATVQGAGYLAEVVAELAKLPNGTTVKVTGTGAEIKALWTSDFTDFLAKVTAYDASDNAISLTKANIEAINSSSTLNDDVASMQTELAKLASNDVVTLLDTGTNVALFSAGNFTTLADVDTVDASSTLTIDVAQLNAITNARLKNDGDTVTVAGTSANINNLTISALTNVDNYDFEPTDQAILSVANANAILSASTDKFADATDKSDFTVADTSANLKTFFTTALDATLVGAVDKYDIVTSFTNGSPDATNGTISLTWAEITATGVATELAKLDANDTLELADTSANIITALSTNVQATTGQPIDLVESIDVTTGDTPLVVSVANLTTLTTGYAGLGNVNTAFGLVNANDPVTITDTSANIDTLSVADLGTTLTNVDKYDSSNDLKLSVAKLNAITDARLTAGNTETVIAYDTVSNLVANINQATIVNLNSFANIDKYEATDDNSATPLTLTIAQAVSAVNRLTAGDTITIEAESSYTGGSSITGLNAGDKINLDALTFSDWKTTNTTALGSNASAVDAISEWSFNDSTDELTFFKTTENDLTTGPALTITLTGVSSVTATSGSQTLTITG